MSRLPPAIEPLIDEWARSLSPDPASRITIIEDLLKNANKDRMSEIDRTICVQALSKLKDQPEETSKGLIPRKWSRACDKCGAYYMGDECPMCEDLTI